jgi:hypothetical protein
MRSVRIILRAQLGGIVLGTAALVYLLGFDSHPHHVLSACLTAACYAAITGSGTFFSQKAWRAQARKAGSAALRPDGGVSTSGAGLEMTARRVVRHRRTWQLVALLGAAMLIAFFVLVNLYAGPTMDLESSGARVEGVVTDVMGQGEAPFDGAIEVQYVYGGQTFDAHIYRDDNSPFYYVGEAVTVAVDPSDPGVATVGGSDNEGPAEVLLFVALLLLGAVALLMGSLMLIGMRLTRRKARRTTVQADVFH